MKIAITGASGYVGGRLADYFRERGHEVLSLSRRPCPEPWAYYSLEDDPHVLPWEGVQALIHAAHDFTPSTWAENLERNVIPSGELLKAAQAAGVGRIVFLSSLSAYERCRSNYGKAKLAIEGLAQDLGAAVVRPGLVWGESSGGVMGALETLVGKTPLVPYLTGRGGLRQYLVHESDLCEAILEIVTSPVEPRPQPYTIAHPEPLSLLRIIQRIARRRHLKRLYFPIHWLFAWMGLRTGERVKVPLLFRSDSLIGLVYGNPKVEIAELGGGHCYRPFR